MALWHDIAVRLARPFAVTGSAPAVHPPPETLLVDTEAGQVALRLFRPTGAETKPPVYIHFHDGGFIRDAGVADDALCRALSDRLGCVVLSPALATAPETRFPVAATQSLALAWWASFAGRRLGWDGKRIALGGQGAGANLAIGTCLDLPARMGFKPVGLVANMPLLDLAAPPEGLPWLSRAGIAAYLPDRVARAAPLASPLRAETLAGFPPALLTLGAGDPWRDQGETFGRRLEGAGRGVQITRLPENPEAAAQAMLAAMAAFLASRFAEARPGP